MRNKNKQQGTSDFIPWWDQQNPGGTEKNNNTVEKHSPLSQPPLKPRPSNKKPLALLFALIGVAAILLVVIVAVLIWPKSVGGGTLTVTPPVSSMSVNSTAPITPSPTPAMSVPPETSPPLETPTPVSPSPTSMGPTAISDLQIQLYEFFDKQNPSDNDKWSVYFLDVASGDYAYAAADGKDAVGDPIIAASLIKLFIAGAVFQAEKDGELTLTDSNISDLTVMIRDSDNESANRLVEKLGGGNFTTGAAKVNAFAKSEGCSGTELNRKLLAPVGAGDKGDNYTTVEDCAKVLRMIAQRTYVSADASDQIYTWMKAASTNSNKASKIRAGVAITSPDAIIANKTGENTTPCIIENDVAIITEGDSQYILCVMSNSKDSGSAKKEIISIAELVDEFYNN